MPVHAAKKSVRRSSAVRLFARNFFKHPSMLGSIIPSSPFLVRRLIKQVDWERPRVIVEFGPGVGTITREILKHMRQDAVLLAIELNEEFVQYLSSTIRDPRLRIVHASAADIRRILSERDFASADCIISSIPYSLLPDPQRRKIVRESRRALKPKGTLLVFQYNRVLLPHLKSNFRSVKQDIHYLNILPALIFHCTP